MVVFLFEWFVWGMVSPVMNGINVVLLYGMDWYVFDTTSSM